MNDECGVMNDECGVMNDECQAARAFPFIIHHSSLRISYRTEVHCGKAETQTIPLRRRRGGPGALARGATVRAPVEGGESAARTLPARGRRRLRRGERPAGAGLEGH